MAYAHTYSNRVGQSPRAHFISRAHILVDLDPEAWAEVSIAHLSAVGLLTRTFS